MRKRHRDSLVDITTSALEILYRFASATNQAFFSQKKFYHNLSKNGYSRQEISNRVRELINSGHIEATEESGRKSVRLSRKGKIKFFAESNTGEIDKKWRIISFDIPENIKTKRFALIRFLRRIGYRPIQKSLWVCPFNKADQVQLILDELSISQYVANFEISKTDIENHLKDLFDDVI